MEISEKQLHHEQRLFKRLVLSSDDFNHAKLFASALLEMPAGDEKKALREALQTAMIVSYWRPFSQNEGSDDAAPTLPAKKFLKPFSETEMRVHKRIRELRNTVMAHSDSSVYGINVSVKAYKDVKWALPILWNPWAPMDREDLLAIVGNTEKLIASVYEEMLRIQELLPAPSKF